MLIRVGDLPIDFVQLLQDLLDEKTPDGYALQDFEMLRSPLLPLEPHRMEHEEIVFDSWGRSDYRLMFKFKDLLIQGIKLPPLIVETRGGLLRDGYHRWAALTNLGRDTWPMLVLDELREARERIT